MRHEIKALKHLGQHFLSDQNVIQKILDAINNLNPEGRVLEIGPGTGAITAGLIELYGRRLSVYEIDQRSIEVLKTKFALGDEQFKGDFLSSDLAGMDGKLCVVGNLPYNIGSQILFKILDFQAEVDTCLFMLQKEVAVRICSPPGNKDYGILSVLLQSFFETRYLFSISPGSFTPPPKVNSGILMLKKLRQPGIQSDPVLFRKVVKAAFNQRRKTLRNALKTLGKADLEGMPFADKRAEQLHVTEFDQVTSFFSTI